LPQVSAREWKKFIVTAIKMHSCHREKPFLVQHYGGLVV